MGKFLFAVRRAAKVILLALAASVGRIARSQGTGVIETAIQNAVREVADAYVRSVNV